MLCLLDGVVALMMSALERLLPNLVAAGGCGAVLR